jgi:hypothetical protein
MGTICKTDTVWYHPETRPEIKIGAGFFIYVALVSLLLLQAVAMLLAQENLHFFQ